MTRQPDSLLRLVARRIITFGLIAVVLQIGIVFSQYWFDSAFLSRSLLEKETLALSRGLSDVNGKLSFAVPDALAGRYGEDGQTSDPAPSDADSSDSDASPSEMIPYGYYVRVRTSAGSVLYTDCKEECTEHFLPLTVNPPNFWLRTIVPGKPLTFAGGRTFQVDGKGAEIEVAVVGDPEGLFGSVLMHEMFDHLIVPMTLMFVLVFGSTIQSIRRALSPISRAVERAEAMDPRDSSARLPSEGLPLEISQLIKAVNRAFDRIQDLIRGQRLFASSIAHEIRTPAAIVGMELERIDHPRARKALNDIGRMTHMLEQLSELARLDAVDHASFRSVDLLMIASDVVARLAPGAYSSGKTIELIDNGSDPINGNPALIETLLRNLVDNAIRYNPPGTTISVQVGPGAALRVIDDGVGLDHAAHGEAIEGGFAQKSGGLGIGRRLAERIAELHGGTMHVQTALGQGTDIDVRFGAPRPS
ncbi:Sensor protein BasS [Hartmannibacter diazotrophicus]|uniref:histidine kinase n=1 Tax=Hartmannibacter diazotrophicus TaxID=1482074 RepID=A0A2C9D7H9_9HYPH|nr:ATP-binding protein [Hartmannibacter diazotrophicus]SON56236.1 Sensor protein BasS [Hartmannibacter diazotrophicus]